MEFEYVSKPTRSVRTQFETFECNGVNTCLLAQYVPDGIRNLVLVNLVNEYNNHKRKNAEWEPFSINNIQNTVNCIYYWDYLFSSNSDLSSSNLSDTLSNFFNFFDFSVVADLLSGYMIPPSSSIYGLSG